MIRLRHLSVMRLEKLPAQGAEKPRKKVVVQRIDFYKFASLKEGFILVEKTKSYALLSSACFLQPRRNRKRPWA